MSALVDASVLCDFDVVSSVVVLVSIVVDFDILELSGIKIEVGGTEEGFPNALSDCHPIFSRRETVAVLDFVLGPTKRTELDRVRGQAGVEALQESLTFSELDLDGSDLVISSFLH